MLHAGAVDRVARGEVVGAVERRRRLARRVPPGGRDRRAPPAPTTRAAGLSCCQRLAARRRLGPADAAVVCRICRCRLVRSTASPSTSVSGRCRPMRGRVRRASRGRRRRSPGRAQQAAAPDPRRRSRRAGYGASSAAAASSFIARSPRCPALSAWSPPSKKAGSRRPFAARIAVRRQFSFFDLGGSTGLASRSPACP